VIIIQFMKSGRYGEHAAADRFGPELTILRMGPRNEGDVQPTGTCYRWVDADNPAQEDIDAAEAALHHAAHIINSCEYDMVVLDEILTAVACNLVNVSDVLILIRAAAEKTELVLTGRSAPSEVIDEADLVTEMQAVKHYYDRGVTAREGIEF